jgi:DNA-binding GntR family transcriptional regulator
VRILLEGAATRQVAEAAAHDESAQRAFETILAEFERVEIQEPSPARRDRFYELTEAYDQAIISYTRNKHLARQIAELRPHSLRLRIIAHSRTSRLEVSLAEHLAMCRAVVATDGAAATAACIEHLMQTQRTILDAVINPDSSAIPIELVTA